MARSISAHTVTYLAAHGERITVEFAADESAKAWSFMRLCDSLDTPCGFPQAVFA